jgi:hypothetical protein
MDKLKFEAKLDEGLWWLVTNTDYDGLSELEAKVIATICNEAQEPGGPVFDVIEAHWAWQLLKRLLDLEANQY